MAGKGRTNKRAGKKGGKKGTRKNLGKGGSTFLPNIPNMGLAQGASNFASALKPPNLGIVSSFNKLTGQGAAPAAVPAPAPAPVARGGASRKHKYGKK